MDLSELRHHRPPAEPATGPFPAPGSCDFRDFRTGFAKSRAELDRVAAPQALLTLKRQRLSSTAPFEDREVAGRR